MKHTILLADNEDTAREKWGEVLRNDGYTVYLAATSQDARKKLEYAKIDLAIIDARLEDDDLPTDYSGLELAAEEAFRSIPKIILTAFDMDFKAQRSVWTPLGGEPPKVIAFVKKDEGPRTLLAEVRHALEAWPRLSMLSSRVSEQIKADHDAIRSQAQSNYRISLIISIFGFVVILAGIALAWMDKLIIGVVGAATGLLLEALGYLFFTRLDLANKRMDVYHQELLQTYGLEYVLSAAERLPARQENVCIERAIYAFMDSWYPPKEESKSTGHLSLEPGSDEV